MVTMKLERSASALRSSEMCWVRLFSSTKELGHTDLRISSLETTRPGLVTRQESTSKVLGKSATDWPLRSRVRRERLNSNSSNRYKSFASRDMVRLHIS